MRSPPANNYDIHNYHQEYDYELYNYDHHIYYRYCWDDSHCYGWDVMTMITKIMTIFICSARASQQSVPSNSVVQPRNLVMGTAGSPRRSRL